jgi:hypothetical protein
MPIGTGSLYVKDSCTSPLLRKEKRCKNVTETEEADVVQYMTCGGHANYTGLVGSSPLRVVSSIHAGPGQQVFGYSDKQRCDLLMLFETPANNNDDENNGSRRRRRQLHYHNYHGYFWHYQGHFDGCPSRQDQYAKLSIDAQTTLLDSFRRSYAEAMSKVRPDQVTFHYHTSYSCELTHGKRLKSLDNPLSEKTYYNIQELLSCERPDEFYQPPPKHQEYLHKETLIKDIVNDKITGFITISGGRENRPPDASSHFGFCVQNYAPTPEQVSPFTKQQMSEFNGISLEEVDELIAKQPPRTLNSTTFHQEETISTNYLKWLIKERNFVDFDITHFLWFKFGSHTRDFIEPLLQLRHEMKKMGNLAAAEILKLLVNGHYG